MSVPAAAPPPRPEILAPDFDGIPAELRDGRRHVVWRLEYRPEKSPDKPWTKPPYNPTGELAAVSRPASWCGFDEARAAYQAGGYDGIGLVLTAAGALVGFDLDHCRDPDTGAIEPWARAIVERVASYTEISPSGTGLRIIAQGTLPAGSRRRGHLEVYCAGRYLTLTGHHLDGSPLAVEDRSAELEEIHRELFPAPEAPVVPLVARPPVDEDDAALLDRARAARNGDSFRRLFDHGDAGEDHSAADLALANHLVYWTGGDTARADRLFRQSALMRPKWDERHSSDGRTYGQITVAKALLGSAVRTAPPGRRTETPTASNGSEPRDSETPPSPPGSPSRGGDAGDEALPAIVVTDRPLRDITGDALDAVGERNDPPHVFVRSGSLVRPRSDENGRPLLEPMGENELRCRLARVADWRKVGARDVRDVSPPIDVVRDLAALGEWGARIPAVEAITEAPVLRPDGSVLDRAGYDRQTRLLYLPAPGLRLAPVPIRPSAEEVGSALALVNELVADFPFADDGGASRANALALLLTPILRPAIPGSVPLALLDAPQAGTGKSLFSDIVAVIGTGRPAQMMSAPREDAEWEKKLAAVLLAGSTVVTIDNVDHPLDAPTLAAVLTGSTWAARILGRSEMVMLPQRATWMATGNNIRLRGDLPRRCYRIRLDARTSRPWQRTGYRHPQLVSWAMDRRGDLLAALLTMARAWYASDEASADAAPVLGGFEEWARAVGGVLAVAGVTGFLANLESLYAEADEEAPQWEGFLAAILERFGARPVTAAEIGGEARFDGSVIREALPDDLADVLASPKVEGSFQRRLGKALSKRTDVRFGAANLHLAKAGESRGVVLWRVRTDASAAESDSTNPAPSTAGMGVMGVWGVSPPRGRDRAGARADPCASARADAHAREGALAGAQACAGTNHPNPQTPPPAVDDDPTPEALL